VEKAPEPDVGKREEEPAAANTRLKLTDLYSKVNQNYRMAQVFNFKIAKLTFTFIDVTFDIHECLKVVFFFQKAFVYRHEY
jgi:hypothetical protein